MNVLGQVDRGNSSALVYLEQPVATHEVVCGLHVFEALGSSHFLGVEQRVAGNEIPFVQELLKLRIQVPVCRPHVRKGSRTTRAGGRKLVGKEQRVTGSPRVEAGVGVKERISLDKVRFGLGLLDCITRWSEMGLPCSLRPGDCSNRQSSHRFQCSQHRTIHYTSTGAHDQPCCRAPRRRVGQIS